MAEITDFFGKASADTEFGSPTTVKVAREIGEAILSCFDLSSFGDETPVFGITYNKETDPVTGDVTITNQTGFKALVNLDTDTLTNFTISPGYTDEGNQVGDYVELIPTSEWANSLINGLLISLNPDGTLKTEPIQDFLDGGNTAENLRIKQRSASMTTGSTLAMNIDNANIYTVSAQAEALSIPNPTGTPNDNDIIIVKLKDNGTSRAISYGTDIVNVSGVDNLTATTANKWHTLGLSWNAAAAKWHILSISTGA